MVYGISRIFPILFHRRLGEVALRGDKPLVDQTLAVCPVHPADVGGRQRKSVQSTLITGYIAGSGSRIEMRAATERLRASPRTKTIINYIYFKYINDIYYFTFYNISPPNLSPPPA